VNTRERDASEVAAELEQRLSGLLGASAAEPEQVPDGEEVH